MSASSNSINGFNAGIPLPAPLDLSDPAHNRENFQTFKFAWSNYEIASGLNTLHVADQLFRFTTALGYAGQNMLLTRDLNESDRSSISALLTAMEKFLCGPVNVRLDRKVFNQARQSPNESYKGITHI